MRDVRSAASGERSGCGNANAGGSAAECAFASICPTCAAACDNAECYGSPIASSTDRECFSGTDFERCCDAARGGAGRELRAKG